MLNNLRELRAERGWSQADLADKLNVSRQTVNAVETGKYDPSLPLAFGLAHLFGKRIEEIFGWVKTTGGFRKSRYRGVERSHAAGQYVVAALNLLRMAKLWVTDPPRWARA